jgi:Zn2+/Cd2+-exporting ATPase
MQSNPNKHSHSHACSCEPPSNHRGTIHPRASGYLQTTLQVAGMDCAEETRAIERALEPDPRVRAVQFNLIAGKVIVSHAPEVSPIELIRAIESAGLEASLPEARPGDELSTRPQQARTVAVSISGLALMFGLILQWSGGTEALRVGAFALSIVSGGWFILPKAIRAARQLTLDMNVLMTVAVAGAAGIGEWAEGAAVAFLFALSELLESFSVARARRAIQSLLQLSPETAVVQSEAGWREVPVESVRPGELLLIKSGARVPLDGEVVSGRSTVNQAPITGESAPVEKEPGSFVFAGTINGPGAIEVRATRPYNQTTLARIIHLVEEAQAQKAPSQRFVDQFAKYYTPSVLALAAGVLLAPPLLMGGDWLVWFYRSLVLLVIACPCALVVSTPVSIVSGLTAMARRGVLIKGGAFLEAVGKLRALAVDKTGTITEGKPRVIRLHALGASEPELIQVAATIDSHSDHPLARAVTDFARERSVPLLPASDYHAIPGRGAEATIDGEPFFAGNHHFAEDLGVCSKETERLLKTIEQEAQSVVIVGRKSQPARAGEVLGVFAIADAIRPEAAEAIRALHRAGIDRVVMLSGDNKRTVEAIARQTGIDEAEGDLLPEDKIARIQELTARYKFAGMIGDGVNDAPAMAAATVGIAMGEGTDTALEVADMALMKSDLGKVAEAVRLGRRTVRIIQANIAFALSIKAIFLALAVAGYTSLWLAILADTGATLLVVANALRLLRTPHTHPAD